MLFLQISLSLYLSLSLSVSGFIALCVNIDSDVVEGHSLLTLGIAASCIPSVNCRKRGKDYIKFITTPFQYHSFSNSPVLDTNYSIQCSSCAKILNILLHVCGTPVQLDAVYCLLLNSTHKDTLL